ncbi:hypothetical protein [Anaerosalibacter sp. Marseille-P3206]|nr:hypothetical protein [Anaerosalibacter sp. Marseille-P3206]
MFGISGIVNMKDDIDPDEIEEKLEFVECKVIKLFMMYNIFEVIK